MVSRGKMGHFDFSPGMDFPEFDKHGHGDINSQNGRPRLLLPNHWGGGVGEEDKPFLTLSGLGFWSITPGRCNRQKRRKDEQ
jgi:hypothetical protein